MKDYKLSEIKKICEGKTDGDCGQCPIENFCWGELTNCQSEWEFNIEEKDGDEE